MELILSAPFTSGTLTHWLVSADTALAVGQPMAVIVTEDQELVLPATLSGTISALLVPPGAPLSPALPLLRLAASAGPAATPARTTPLARRIAQAHDLDLAPIQGSGVAGRIMKQDVLSKLPSRAPADGFCIAEQLGAHTPPTPLVVPPPRAALSPATIVATTRPVAPVITQAQLTAASPQPVDAAPTAILVQEVDGSLLLAHVASPASVQRGVDVPALLAWAVAQTLWHHPTLRTHWHADGLIRRAAVSLEIDLAGNHYGIADAADLTALGMARALHTASAVAPTAPVCTLHYASQPSTAAWWSSPRLPAGRSLLVAISHPQLQPVVRRHNGLDQIESRPILTLVLVFDMRSITPWDADTFLAALKQRLEQLHLPG